jgi:hypothetical protein
MTQIPETGRLALREEGTLWVAYFAQPGTMDGAVFLGSIRMRFVVDKPAQRSTFIALMRDAVNDLFEREMGIAVENWEERPAPEHERGESKLAERDWTMSLAVVEELQANPTGDMRAIIADWLRKARIGY